MSGIYIHIPFCKKACHYCNFHFSTSLQYKDAFMKALLAEIELRKNYLNVANEQTLITSIYFGGGTPSILSYDEIQLIFDAVHQHFSINAAAEITMECNPDDLTIAKIEELKRTPVNRLSIGVQSFFDDDLQLMNRAHNSGQAHQSIAQAAAAGFENITLDLMYALPTLSDEKWIKNLETALALPINHLSCYNLTVEEQTALAHLIKKGKVPAVDENRAIHQFEILQQLTAQHDFEHYEISNFAKDGKYSKHNSSYWKGNSYVGFGPSAHSYNGFSRQWNIANNQQYHTALLQGDLIFEKEILSVATQYNEYVMTSLRTIWGADLNYINTKFGLLYKNHFVANVQPFLIAEEVIETKNIYTLSPKGKLIADAIASQLFKVE